MKKAEGPPDATLMMFGSHRVLEGSFKAYSGSVKLIHGEGKCVTGANSADVITGRQDAASLEIHARCAGLLHADPKRERIPGRSSFFGIPDAKFFEGSVPRR